jgi:hypothetical protein
MAETKIPPMKAPVHTLPRADGSRAGSRRRDQRMSRVIQARRRLSSPRGGGRAWINGSEVGGADSRYAHLSAIYD